MVFFFFFVVLFAPVPSKQVRRRGKAEEVHPAVHPPRRRQDYGTRRDLRREPSGGRPPPR